MRRADTLAVDVTDSGGQPVAVRYLFRCRSSVLVIDSFQIPAQMPRRSRRRQSIYGLVLTLLAGCAEGVPADSSDFLESIPEAERFGGTAVVGIPYDLAGLNPLTTQTINTAVVAAQVLFTPLFRGDGQLEPLPVLVESWDTVRISPDSLALTLRLRRGVMWHDGVPTTAADVRFSYERARDPRTGFEYFSNFDRFHPQAEVLDDYTIRFRMRAHAAFLANLMPLVPAPRHLLQNVPPEELARHAYARQPVGNGPFRFVRYEPGQQWTFDSNPNYPSTLGGRPYLDRLILRIVPEPTARLTELLSGGIDVMLGATAQQTAALSESPNIRLISAPASGFDYIGWNARLPIFQDPRVRRALTMAMDRQALVDAVRPGEVPGTTTIRPFDWMYDGDITLPYDRAGAESLLEEAGWKDRDGDGIRENVSGTPLRFTALSIIGTDRGDILTVLQSQLRHVGADLRPRVLEANSVIEMLRGSPDSSGERVRNFEAVLIGIWIRAPKDDAPLLHSRNRNGPLSVANFQNPRADWLLDTLALTLGREPARPLWREYQELIAREAPMSVISYRQYLVGVRSRLRDVEVDPSGEFVTVSRWWISPNHR